MRTIDKFRKIWADRSSVKKYNWPQGRRLVSFTFDDVDESAFKNGGSLLHDHAMKGTFYVAFSFMEGQEGNESIFTEKDVGECVKQGHELGSHTYGHLHAFQASRASFEEDLKKNQDALEAHGLGRRFESFSYPYGEQTRGIKSLVDQQFNTSRGIGQGINQGLIDLNNLKTIKLYESVNTLPYIFEQLERLLAEDGWLIFYTHDVQENYSKYGCSPRYLSQVIDQVKKMSLEVSTIKEAIPIGQ